MAKANAESLVSKKGANSPVWQCFGFLGDENGKPRNMDSPICKLCMKAVLAKGGNTSNLRTHLMKKHPVDAHKLHLADSRPNLRPDKTIMQTSLPGPITAFSKYGKDSRWNACTSAVTRFLVHNMLSFDTLEKPTFRDLLKTFDPLYELPSMTFFSDTVIPDLYGHIRQDAMSMLSQAEYCAFSINMWSPADTDTYMSLSVHFVTPDWKLMSRCLETCFFPADHSTSDIRDWLREAVSEWDIEDERISGVTTNDALTITAAAKGLGWPLMTCFGCNLDLAVNSTIQSHKRRTDRVFGLCRSITGAFSHSWRRKRALMEAQTELGLPLRNLVTDCVTGWGSKQEMVSRILEQQQAIRHVLADDRRASVALRWQDIDMLTALNEALKPVADLTSVLSRETYITSSSVLPLLSLIREDIMAPSDGDVALAAELKTAIARKLDGKYTDGAMSLLLGKCTLLDPRYGGTFDVLDEVKSAIATEIALFRKGDRTAVRVKEEEDVREGRTAIGMNKEVGRKQQSPIRVKEEARSEPRNKEASREQPPAKKLRTLGSLLGKRTIAAASLSVEEQAKAEIDAYLVEPAIEGQARYGQHAGVSGQKFGVVADGWSHCGGISTDALTLPTVQSKMNLEVNTFLMDEWGEEFSSALLYCSSISVQGKGQHSNKNEVDKDLDSQPISCCLKDGFHCGSTAVVRQSKVQKGAALHSEFSGLS
ncbi:hypothetical protein GJAV_G00008120 [Gymnothorax javanicus]|nr:hypothetical protein GJAV_G00008120 [Gymnothorax javanicus]